MSFQLENRNIKMPAATKIACFGSGQQILWGGLQSKEFLSFTTDKEGMCLILA